MKQPDEVAQRFTEEPGLELSDDRPPSLEELERQLADHPDYVEGNAHPDDQDFVEPAHEEILGSPPNGSGVEDVPGGDALKREVIR